MRIKNSTIKIIKNTFIQSGGKFISAGLGLITVGLLTRYLGASKYGDFTLVFSYLAFFGVIADFGMQLAMVREFSYVKNVSIALYATYFWLKFLLIVLSDVLAVIILFFLPYSLNLKLGIIIGIAAVSVSGLSGYFNVIFQSQIKLELLTILDLIAKFFTVISIIFFVILKLNFYFIVSTVLLGNLISFLIGFYLLKYTIRWHFEKEIAKRLLVISIPVGLTTFISTLYFKVDTIILSLFKSTNDVGLYSLSYKILENIIVFWGFYMATTYPLLAYFKGQKNEKEYNKLLKNSKYFGFLSSLLVVIVVFVIAPFIINIFGGASFSQGSVILRILIFTLPFNVINNVYYNFNIVEGKNMISLIGITIALFLNIILNIIFIPKYSYIAASYITVLSEILIFITYIIGERYKKNI